MSAPSGPFLANVAFHLTRLRPLLRELNERFGIRDPSPQREHPAHLWAEGAVVRHGVSAAVVPDHLHPRLRAEHHADIAATGPHVAAGAVVVHRLVADDLTMGEAAPQPAADG